MCVYLSRLKAGLRLPVQHHPSIELEGSHNDDRHGLQDAIHQILQPVKRGPVGSRKRLFSRRTWVTCILAAMKDEVALTALPQGSSYSDKIESEDPVGDT
jgi:hypothetical protein